MTKFRNIISPNVYCIHYVYITMILFPYMEMKPMRMKLDRTRWQWGCNNCGQQSHIVPFWGYVRQQIFFGRFEMIAPLKTSKLPGLLCSLAEFWIVTVLQLLKLATDWMNVFSTGKRMAPEAFLVSFWGAPRWSRELFFFFCHQVWEDIPI